MLYVINCRSAIRWWIIIQMEISFLHPCSCRAINVLRYIIQTHSVIAYRHSPVMMFDKPPARYENDQQGMINVTRFNPEKGEREIYVCSDPLQCNGQSIYSVRHSNCSIAWYDLKLGAQVFISLIVELRVLEMKGIIRWRTTHKLKSINSEIA